MLGGFKANEIARTVPYDRNPSGVFISHFIPLSHMNMDLFLIHMLYLTHGLGAQCSFGSRTDTKLLASLWNIIG